MATTRMEYDDSRARTELGYTSAPARDALARAARWYVEHGFVKDSQLRRIRSAGRLGPEIDLRDDVDRTRDGSPAPFDVRALLDARGPEAFALHERYLNPQMPRVLRTIGFDRDYVRARARTSSIATAGDISTFSPGSACSRSAGAIRRSSRRCGTRSSLALPNLVQMECQPLSGPARRSARRPDAERRVPLLLHEQRRRVGRDRAQVRCAARPAAARPVRRSRLPRAHDRRVVAERRARVPRPLRRAAAGLYQRAVRRPRRVGARARRRATSPRSSSSRSRARACSSRPRATSRPRPSCVTGTARSSRSTRCRPASGAPARSSRSSSGTSSPISSPSPRRCRADTSRSARSSRRRRSSRRCSTRWTARSCTARRSVRTCSR